MDVKPILAEESVDVLPEYGRIPISFEVHSVFQVELVEGGLQGIRLSHGQRITMPSKEKARSHRNIVGTVSAVQMLMVETQNINVPACRFYARHGFTLGA